MYGLVLLQRMDCAMDDIDYAWLVDNLYEGYYEDDLTFKGWSY